MSLDLLSLKNPLYSICLEASEAIMEIYNQPHLFDIDLKADQSPLTAADKASNEIICRRLSELDPQLPIISEENKEITYSERSTYEYCWMVDPLDGTKEFIKRNGEFTINIALIHHNAPVAGLVYIPATGLSYFGAAGQGAYRIEKGVDLRLSCDPFVMDQAGIRVLTSRSHMSTATQAYVDKLNTPQLVARGSSLKFTVICEGQGDLYPRIGPTMEWDTAAAHIILQEAGGDIVEFATGKSLSYNKPSLLNPDFVAFGSGQLA